MIYTGSFCDYANTPKNCCSISLLAILIRHKVYFVQGHTWTFSIPATKIPYNGKLHQLAFHYIHFYGSISKLNTFK